MNRVHEPCPKIGSGTVLSQTGPKTGRVHQVHSPSQPMRPGRPASPAPRSRACCHSPTARALACRAPRCVVAWLVVSRPCVATQSNSPLPPLLQYSFMYYNIILHNPLSFSHNTLGVLQYTTSPTSPANLQYTLVYCNTVPKPRSLPCNTIFLMLQYKPIKLHPLRLQYNFSYCNIKPAIQALQAPLQSRYNTCIVT